MRPYHESRFKLKQRLSAVFLVALLLSPGCTTEKQSLKKAVPFPQQVGKMVVFGFRSAVQKGMSPDTIRSPISGSAFIAEPVPPQKVDFLTEALFKHFTSSQRYNLVSPSQAQGVLSTLLKSNPTMDEMELFREIGRSLSADAVLAGYIYRWRDRVGTDYAADAPASVDFDLYLIRPSDGRILWKGVFDKTQKPLSENLLEMETFVESGGKWVTAEQLARIGLDRLLGDLRTGREVDKKQ